MISTEYQHPLSCAECLNGTALGFNISMAFQPIVDMESRTVFSYEALVRGPSDQPASWVLEKVNDSNRYRFDQTCRVKAIKTAADLNMKTMLNINFLPNAVYEPAACIRTTLNAANEFNFPVNQIIFEVTEAEKVRDPEHLNNIIQEYKHRGFLTAIDDFGAGFSGLNLLSKFQPNYIKLDGALTRNIHEDRTKRVIVKSIIEVSNELGIQVIAEGVEKKEELEVLRELGIHLFQGYLFAKPAFETLPVPEFEFDS